MKVVIEYYQVPEYLDDDNVFHPTEIEYIATMPQVRLSVVGKTKQEAFDELMISLRVKLLHENELTEIN